MTTKEAIQAMLDGNKVMPKGWVDACVFFNGIHFVREDGKQFLFGSLEYQWEIYEEPKPRQVIVIEKWLIRDCLDIETVIEINAEQLDFFLPEANSKKVKLLDTYEVEL